MEDADKIKQRFELLKMARELLNEDYINRRAEDHNKWVAENDELWRTKRRNLPYPPFAQYPTDDEIVKAALNLYNFIYMESREDVNVQEAMPPVQTKDPEPIANYNIPSLERVIPPPPTIPPSGTELIPEKSSTVLEIPEETPPKEDYRSPTVNEVKAMEATVAATRSILPGWVRRSIGNS